MIIYVGVDDNHDGEVGYVDGYDNADVDGGDGDCYDVDVDRGGGDDDDGDGDEDDGG